MGVKILREQHFCLPWQLEPWPWTLMQLYFYKEMQCFWQKKGYIEHVRACGLKPLKELMDSFLEMGGKLLVCQPCINERKIGTEDLIEGAKPSGSGEITKEILEGHSTLVY